MSESSVFFPGSVSEAIMVAKASKRPILVLLTGDSGSHEEEQLQMFEAGALNDLLCRPDTPVIPLHLRLKEESGQQFSAVFPVASTPTVYIVNPDMQPLFTRSSFVSEEELLKVVDSFTAKSSKPESSPQNVTITPSPPAPVQPSEPRTGEVPKPAKKPASFADFQKRERERILAAAQAREQGDELDKYKRIKLGVHTRKDLVASQSRKMMGFQPAEEGPKSLAAMKRARAKAAASAVTTTSAAPAPAPAASAATTSTTPASPSSSTEATLQVRLSNGKTLRSKFSATASLSVVRDYVMKHRDDGSEPFNLASTFPKRTFTAVEASESLLALGLAPNASLLLVKTTAADALSKAKAGAQPVESKNQADASSRRGSGGILSSLGGMLSSVFSPAPTSKQPGAKSGLSEPLLRNGPHDQ